MTDAAIAERAAVIMAGEPDCLDAIAEPGVAIAVWHRAAPTRIERAFFAERLNVRFSSTLGTLCDPLRDAMTEAGYRSGVTRHVTAQAGE